MNDKQAVFVEEYVKTWNASESARRAGYKGDANTVGPRLLANVGVKEAIAARLKEIAMDTNEVLARLAEQARVSVADFVHEKTELVFDKEGGAHEVVTVGLNWEAIKEKGHLIKSIKPTAAGIAIELHDAQTALIQIGKGVGAFLSDSPNVTVNVSITPEQMAKAREKAKAFEDEQ